VIIRVIRHETNFTVIDNACLRDCTLSFKATGLLAYLLSMPDEWTPRRDQLAEVKTDGVASIRAALAELTAAGYLVRKVERLPDGRTVTVSELHERPVAENRPVGVRKSHLQPVVNQPVVDQPAENQPALEIPSLTTVNKKVFSSFGEMRTMTARGES
jgi:hypothetical protein